jgi:hypothetical protein
MHYNPTGKTLKELQDALDKKKITSAKIIKELQNRADKPTCAEGKRRRSLEAIERLQLTERVIAPHKSSNKKKSSDSIIAKQVAELSNRPDSSWTSKLIPTGAEEKQQLLTELLNSMSNQPVVIVINK